jgi:hypothetical protein
VRECLLAGARNEKPQAYAWGSPLECSLTNDVVGRLKVCPTQNVETPGAEGPRTLAYAKGRRRDLRHHKSNRVAEATPVGIRVDGSGTRVTLTSSNDQ